MNREEFIKKSVRLGLSLPFLNVMLGSCSENFFDTIIENVNFSGKVIIIGAGASGLTAGYILHSQGIDFEIIEAAPNYGGRVKRNDNFIDLPLDMGAEWIHEDPSILAQIINDPSVKLDIDITDYTPKTVKTYKNGKLRNRNWTSPFQSEHKFKSTTWYGFFEKYIVPSIEYKIRLNQAVNRIDYSGEKVIINTQDGTTYQGDKVLVTVPAKILQNNSIEFTPPLPSQKIENINKIQMEEGLKVFIEFSERFYPDMTMFGGVISNMVLDKKTYFDAVFDKDTNRNVLGLFVINEEAAEFTKLGSDQAIFEAVLAELDKIFEGKASQFYIKHIVQNWTAEPFIQGSYSYEFDGNRKDIVENIVEPLKNKVYFAGEAFSIDNQATVHGACESAYSIMKEVLK